MAGDSLTAPQQISSLESFGFSCRRYCRVFQQSPYASMQIFFMMSGGRRCPKDCELPEYYITRTEIDILDRNRPEIASHLGPISG